MKQIRDNISVDLNPLTIYEDELLEIHAFLKKNCSGKITIKSCGYELDTINEIKELPNSKAHDFHFHSDQPYLSIDLSSHSSRIYCGDTSLEAEGIISRIAQILRKGERKTTGISNHTWLSFVVGLPCVIGAWTANWPLVIVGIILMFTTTTIFIWEERIKTGRHSTIIFKSRKDSPNFWIRNKDKILLLILGALFGSMCTILITFLKPYLIGKP